MPRASKVDERSLSEPSTERNQEGQEIAITELLSTNISIIKHEMRCKRLRIRYFDVGTIAMTRVAVLWVDGIADPATVADVIGRIRGLEVKFVPHLKIITDELDEPNMKPFQAFKTMERYDAVIGEMMNGRIVVFCDGTPLAASVPFLFFENFAFAGDYTANYGRYVRRWIRLFQYLSFIYIPALYLILSRFYLDDLPEQLVPVIHGKELLDMPWELIVIVFIVRQLLDTTFRVNRNLVVMFSIMAGAIYSIMASETLLINSYVLAVVSYSEIVAFALLRRLGPSLIVLQTIMGIVGYFFNWQGVALATGVVLLRMCLATSYGVPFMSPIVPPRPREWLDSIFFVAKLKTIVNKKHKLTKGWRS